jgi:hypothetical protein
MGTDSTLVTHFLHSVTTNSNVESCSPNSIWADSNSVPVPTPLVLMRTLPLLQTLCLLGIMIFLMCSKRKMQIGCQNTASTIARLIYKRVPIHRSVPSMDLLNQNWRHLGNISRRTLRRDSFNPQNPRSAPQSYLSRRRTGPYDYAWIIEASIE